ncbi:Uncharacterised protein [Legionella pneumophila]|nr:Uncharacterised protein [Legionella pneumophila]CZI80515.1 Uncharacterised protein [Legionella pneumophila]CZJ28825.1 Uncharacterised protein [Legionella pneumophila]SNW01109.1 Uncharacterised protein [Legionella pneumophila]SQG86698.1 Uncharacterised protein [Legionella pneumophila]
MATKCRAERTNKKTDKKSVEVAAHKRTPPKPIKKKCNC